MVAGTFGNTEANERACRAGETATVVRGRVARKLDRANLANSIGGSIAGNVERRRVPVVSEITG